MIPFSPALEIRPLTVDEAPAVAALINPSLTRTPYSRTMDPVDVQKQIFSQEPPGIHAVRWRSHRQIGAWRAGRLLGFLDVAVGLDSDSAELPDHLLLGQLRFMTLPDQSDLLDEIAHGLLDAAAHYWRAAGVGRVNAFHLSTGYTPFQAGAGILPGDWVDHVRILTSVDYRLVDRYYCLRRLLHRPVEEETPLAGINLILRGVGEDRRYELFRRTDPIGSARLVVIPSARSTRSDAVRLVDLFVDAQWRGQDIGKWLLRRIVNDLTLQGFGQIVAFLHHSQHIAMNLLNQHGFDELNYRGYTLEKLLTE